MKRLIVYPYKMGSASAKLLARELEAKRVYPDREYSPKPNDVIINWGNGNRPLWADVNGNWKILNHWKNICFAIDKDVSFTKFVNYGINIPELTRSRSVAIDWLEDNHVVIGRQLLEGTRGQGVIEMAKLSQFQNCLLYTKYEETTKEFRVYIFNGKFIDCLEKRRDSEMLAQGKINYRVRTEENGWVFCRANVVCPKQVADQAVLAVKALGLVFGGVDVIWNEPKKKAVVLEVNTAPGIFGNTVPLLANQIRQYSENLS